MSKSSVHESLQSESTGSSTAVKLVAAFFLVISLFAGGVPAINNAEAAEKLLYVAPNGSDTAAGTAAAPLKKIQKALNKALPGTRIIVKQGVYAEHFETVRNGTAQAPIVLQASGKVILTGDSSDEEIAAIEHHHNRITGFEFDGSSGKEKLLEVEKVTGAIVINNYFHNATEECLDVEKDAKGNSYTKNRFAACEVEKFLCANNTCLGQPQPTVRPVTAAPTKIVSKAPTAVPSKVPTAAVTKAPTAVPSKVPTVVVSKAPTAAPTRVPTSAPTRVPTLRPSATPTRVPTAVPPAPPSGTAQYPDDIINLRTWKLTLPTGANEDPTEIKEQQLWNNYVNDPYFVLNSTRNGVRFRAPVTGVTTSGSDYPRTELREMNSTGEDGASWSSTSGTHTMYIDQAITHTPIAKPHVVAGQIHGGSDDLIVIRLEGSHLFINSDAAEVTLTNNYVLGTRFNVKFDVSGGQTRVYYNGVLKHTMNMSYSGAYFKAGAYTQSNCERESTCSSSNYGEVVIYNLQVTHK